MGQPPAIVKLLQFHTLGSQPPRQHAPDIHIESKCMPLHAAAAAPAAAANLQSGLSTDLLMPDAVADEEKRPGNKGRARAASMIEEINAMIEEDRMNKSRPPRRARHHSPHRESRASLPIATPPRPPTVKMPTIKLSARDLARVQEARARKAERERRMS